MFALCDGRTTVPELHSNLETRKYVPLEVLRRGEHEVRPWHGQSTQTSVSLEPDRPNPVSSIKT